MYENMLNSTQSRRIGFGENNENGIQGYSFDAYALGSGYDLCRSGRPADSYRHTPSAGRSAVPRMSAALPAALSLVGKRIKHLFLSTKPASTIGVHSLLGNLAEGVSQ
jgi:hypothetical protein